MTLYGAKVTASLALTRLGRSGFARVAAPEERRSRDQNQEPFG